MRCSSPWAIRSRAQTVTIYADGTPLGSAVATDSTTVVTTTGSPAMMLLDGTHAIRRGSSSGESGAALRGRTSKRLLSAK